MKSSERKKFVKKFIKQTVPILSKTNKKNSKYTPTTSENYLLSLGQVIAEIETSFDVLYLLPQIITSHSSYYEKKGFSRVLQHRKNIEWYFNEAYILKERIKKLLNLIKKYLLLAGYNKESKELVLIDKLYSGFLDSVDKLMKTRGKHVHDVSYQDKDLYHVELLDIANRELGYDKYLKADMLFWLKIERKKWKDVIVNNTSSFETIIGKIYSSIEERSLVEKMLR